MKRFVSEYKKYKNFNKVSTVLNLDKKKSNNYGDNWSKISATCLNLANHICSDCKVNRANRAHHIIPLSKGGSNAQYNLKAVCDKCHKRYHSHLN